jgi:hypothetical protein
MPDKWRNHDALKLSDWDDFSIQFHFCIRIALQKDIRFSQGLMVVPFRVRTDFRNVQGSRKLRHPCECTPRLSAWAGNGCDLRKIGQSPATFSGRWYHESCLPIKTQNRYGDGTAVAGIHLAVWKNILMAD